MFKKAQLKKQIKDYKLLITNIELKRDRSQAALVDSILSSTNPVQQDVEYFEKFNTEILEARQKIIELQSELNSL